MPVHIALESYLTMNFQPSQKSGFLAVFLAAPQLDVGGQPA